jgi:Na+/H+ antiporter NhaD/arsenite permease-like protein
MTQVSAHALRAAMDRVDRERSRSKVMLFCLLGLTLAMWIAMMFAKDDHTGLPFGLAAVIGAVFVAGMIAAKASHENTRIILRAIETLSRDQ